MKTITMALMSWILASQVWAQGSLTPSGAPGETMKTLTQVEPRIPVQSLGVAPPYNITQPGSYYLTENITVSSGNAINITASDVSLDLMGFTIESTQETTGGAAINAASMGTTVSRLKIYNGNIQSGSTHTVGVFTSKGFECGIYSRGKILNSTICDIQVNGVGTTGIYCDDGSLVERCKVSNSQSGIYNVASENSSSITRDCIAANCSQSGIIGRLVEGCVGEGFFSYGISATVASNSRGYTQAGTGMDVTECAQNCTGYSGVGTGMNCSGTVTGCRAQTVSGVSLSANIAIGCVISGGTASIIHRYNMP